MKKEFEMRIPVAKWLLSRGLSPICEIQCLGNCDLVGVRFTEKPITLVEMVAIELKLRDVAGVIRQCESHIAREKMTEVWAAMLPDVALRNQKRFDFGIGLLAVTSGGVEIVKQAERREGSDLSSWKNAMRRRRNEHLWRMKHRDMRRAGDVVEAA